MDPLDAVRRLITASDREGAKRALGSILRADPQNVSAWAMLAPLLKDPAQQADCYRQILRIEPHDPPLETSGDRQPKNQFPPLTPDVAPNLAGTRAPAQGPGFMGELRNLLGMSDSASSTSQATRRATLVGLGKAPTQQELLTPEDVIQLAGGALPPAERQTCPRCDAVISRNATRCPWCSASLQG